MNKTVLIWLGVITFCTAITVGICSYMPGQSGSFNVSTDRMTEDLQYRFVMIPPQGQLWGFMPDQKMDIKVLQTKDSDGGVAVAVKMNVLANVAPQTPGAKPAPASQPPSAPVTVELNGVAKLHYEYIAGTWYLADVTSVNLRATQR